MRDDPKAMQYADALLDGIGGAVHKARRLMLEAGVDEEEIKQLVLDVLAHAFAREGAHYNVDTTALVDGVITHCEAIARGRAAQRQ